MKTYLTTLISALMLVAIMLQACGTSTPAASVEQAEDALANGHYEAAQTICDNLVGSPDYEKLTIDELCRLSIVYVKLGENTDNTDANIVAAARSMQKASDRDADSTALFIDAVSVEDRARVALITAINEARNALLSPDTLEFETPDYDEE